MGRKINPASAAVIAFGALLIGCICLLVAGLANLGWASWKNFQKSGEPAALIRIPAGEFLMGSTEGEAVSFKNEKPQHTVYLDEFWIEATKVTNGMYAACVKLGKCNEPGSEYSGWRQNVYENPENLYHPVTNVKWQQARDYCLWLGRDLPTEAQWEKAARGIDGRIYPWGDTIDCGLANYSDCKLKDTTEISKYRAGSSPYGVLDMSGNVWEWTLDWYDASYYAVSPASNPNGPVTGQYKVMRGGSWLNGGQLCAHSLPVYCRTRTPE